jgi:hypothetical protein
MSKNEKKSSGSTKEERRAGAKLELAAMGMEAEFAVVVDGAPARPEDVFGDPRAFLRGELMHRVGR